MGDVRPGSPFIRDSAESSEIGGNGMINRVRDWVATKLGLPSDEPLPASNYLTLVPLSDARLRPRRTKLLVSLLVVLGLLAMTTVYVCVPRGVSIGEIAIQSDTMSWNTTKRTYQLNLKACIPVYNPNFVSASISGTFKVHFYDTEAGSTRIKHVVVPARSKPSKFVVDVDASNVPSDYTLTILKECASFPRRLIFFQKINLTVQYLGQRQVMAPIDTYFMISCLNGEAAGPTSFSCD